MVQLQRVRTHWDVAWKVPVGVGVESHGSRGSKNRLRRWEEKGSNHHRNRERSSFLGLVLPHSLDLGCQLFINDNYKTSNVKQANKKENDLHHLGIRFDRRLVRLLLIDDAERERDLECWGSSRLRSRSRSASFFSFRF